jgi:hypothetical protein
MNTCASARLLAGCIASACVILAVALAPRAGAQDVRVGVRAGPTFGFLNDSVTPFVSEPNVTEASTNVRIDFHAGAHAVLPLAGPFSVQPELLFVRKGAHLSREGPGLYIAEQYQLTYVEAHLLGRRAFRIPGPLSLHAVAGLSGGRVVAASVRRDVHSAVRLREEIDLLRDDLVRRWDVGAVLGVALGYPVGADGRVALELRYAPGFASVFTSAERPPDDRLDRLPDPPPLTAAPPRLRHDVITASLVYTLPLDH